MQITSTHLNSSLKLASSPQARTATVSTEPPAQPNGDSVSIGSENSTPSYVKAGKYALAAASTIGVGALGFYAGNSLGLGAAVAGAATGGLVGATTLGTLGLIADIGGGFLGNSNHSVKAAAVGGVLGAVGGGLVGAALQSPVAGAVLGIAGGVSALVLTGAATNILAK